MKKQIAILIVLCSSTLFAQESKHFIILHTNDTHGHLLPFSFPDRVPAADDIAKMPSRKDVGGIARRAGLMKEIRAHNKNVSCFDAGDCLDGTPFSVEFKDAADYDAMNEVGYDYAVYGNHDFNLKPADFYAAKSHVHFPMVLANVFKKGTDSTILPPYIISNWDGLRVAVLGLVTQSTKDYPAAKAMFDVKSPLEIAKHWVPILRNQVDLVILVTHIGVELDRTIAKEVPGIDIIVGGHSHTRLPEGIFEKADHPGKDDPIGTVILQDGHYTPELGRLDFDAKKDVSGHWRVVKWHEKLLALTSSVAVDPATAAVVDSYWSKIRGKYEQVIGTATDDFTDNENEESTNYYLASDAAQFATKSDFDLENQGGIRAPILKGPIRLYDLVCMDPFDDTIVTADITGKDLGLLLNSLFPQPSQSLHYTIRHTKVNSRTGQKESWEAQSITVNGEPLQAFKEYHLSTNSWMAHEIGRSLNNQRSTGIKRLDAIAAYVKANSPVSPKMDGRIRVEEE